MFTKNKIKDILLKTLKIIGIYLLFYLMLCFGLTFIILIGNLFIWTCQKTPLFLLFWLIAIFAGLITNDFYKSKKGIY